MAEKNWKKRRKKLPRNYVKLVLQKLENDGITLKYTALYDIIRGKNKNTDLTISVFKAIDQIEKETKRRNAKVEKLKLGK
jgi:predicted transcriptional regulator